VIRWFFRLLTVALGLTQIALARDTVGPDARSYLEIARAILRRDWGMTINAYWSVLYPWLLAPMLAIFKPSLRWEFPIAHALAFPVLLACIAAFDFFWSSLLRIRESSIWHASATMAAIPSWQMWVLGYSLFIWWVVGDLITAINPDLCMTTMVLLSAGLLNRMQIKEGTRCSLYLWFGLCLGVGYLVKAVLFPMGLVFLGMMFVTCWHSFRARKWNLASALLIFSLIALPEIILLSRAKGRITFSDAGKLAFAWFNYDLPLRDWQGEPAWSGRPLHPTREIYRNPAVYEFNGPLRSSYPPWYDPSYWNDGMSPVFQPTKVTRHTLAGVFVLGDVLRHPTAWIVGLLVIFFASDLRETFRGILTQWYLIAISATAFALHCLTLVESRYLASWEMLLWGALLAGVRLKQGAARWCGVVATIVCLALVSAIIHLEYGESRHGFHNYAGAEYATAEGLQKMGLSPGTRVGAIGFDNDAYWAYFLGLNIVAEINTDETCLFWSQSFEHQKQILQKFAQAGATVVVANTGSGIRSTSKPVPVPFSSCAYPGPEWRPIDGTADHALFLK
jgi:hypothetical protein